MHIFERNAGLRWCRDQVELEYLSGLSELNHSNLNNSAGSNSLVKFDDGVAQGNRWGVRGGEDLGGGVRAIFNLENGFSVGSGALNQGGREFGRQAFAGLSKSGVGSLTFGRQYSLSQDTLAPFSNGGQTVANNYAYHIADVDQLTASRVDNAVKFKSASYAGLTFGALYGFSNQAGAFAGTPAPSASGGSGRTYSVGVRYVNGPFAAGAALTDERYPGATNYPSPTAFSNVNPAKLTSTIQDSAPSASARATKWEQRRFGACIRTPGSFPSPAQRRRSKRMTSV
ncbi:porin [Paraburkholderia sp. DGU8]|uniref:porin n=1 Tax=Paraburkholderia sp. DGU8 TaxID=3161997 RepID=UPI003466A7BE